MATPAQPTSPTSPTAGRPSSRRTHVRLNTATPNPSETPDGVAEQLQHLDVRTMPTAERISTLEEDLMRRVGAALSQIASVERQMTKTGINVEYLRVKVDETNVRVSDVKNQFRDVLQNDLLLSLGDSVNHFMTSTLGVRMDALEDQMDTLKERMDSLEDRMRALETKVDEGFANVDARLADMDRRLDNMDGRLDNMDGRLVDMDGRLADMNESINTRFTNMNESINTRFTNMNAIVNSRFAEVTTGLALMNTSIDARFIALNNNFALLLRALEVRL